MSILSAKDRVSLCKFTFSDGRRCRTPRTGKNPHFCFDHAQKEARANAEESLSEDLAYFFSGDYLSACDLSTALGRLIPAVIRGDVKPKNARTVAYMAQILLQSIHISEQEYINAFGTDGWRKSIRNSVNANHNHLFPPAPELEPGPDQPAPFPPQAQPVESPVTLNCHSERSEESAFSESPATLSQTTTPARQPAPSPHTSLPSTRAEFVQHVVAGLQTGSSSPSSAPSSNDSAPARTSTTQSAPSSPTPPPAPDNSQRAPAPLASQSTSPQQSQPTQNSQHNSLSTPAPPAPRPAPPGFGAPANWDVLIPPKPRRRFSRLWQSHG